MRYEICLESADGVAAAAEAGADRVELCAGLFEGGITPSLGMIKEAVAVAAGRIKVHVIIRPRGGDFIYTPSEVEVMLEDIEAVKAAGADGVVIGALTPEGEIDTELCARLVEAARPLSVTFHRAFDVARDPLAAFEDVISLGVDRLLTSGAAPSALEGSELIAELVGKAGGRIIILPAGGITEATAARVARETGATELHFTATEAVSSRSRFTRDGIYMGGALYPPETVQAVTTATRVRSIMAAAV
ncbi:copper homeostasis protein CutC [Microtetraspora sp. NBRC 13810]|uniref:copper homeostasis protein CutC n=1 Tax=Microtetraspora sp. NBRC 13810 TaxID=3030990 RepID=UPI0024A20377|nr:copper homeostasis protein CutC [Microtetraspora sp. NBRC 13810]GLW10453.1 copper homeostasis protein CutC [Microtetraspora sp. NBRC 13810]